MQMAQPEGRERRPTEARSAWYGRRLCLAVAAVGAVMIGVFWVGLVYHLDQRRTSILDTTHRDIARLSIALKQQVERVIAAADDDLRSARDAFARAPESFDVAAWVKRRDAARDIAVPVVVTDERGATRGAQADDAAQADVSGQDLFKTLAARDDLGLYVDRTAMQPARGRYALRLARRLNRPDGSFGGIVAVFLDAAYLTGQLRMPSMDADGWAALFGWDGYLRARAPAVETGYEDSLAGTPEGRALFERIRADEGGSLERPCLWEPGACLFAYRSLARWPLSVVVGKGVTETLQPYETERHAILIAGSILSVIVLILLAGLLGELERRRRREIELDAVHRSLQAAHRALGERETVLRAVFEGSADCIDVLGPDGRLYLAGRADPCRAGGEDPAGAIGRAFAALWPEAVRADIAAAVARALGGAKAHVTTECRLADGGVRHLDVLVAPIGGACPPDRLVAITRDVTHLRSAEAALRASEARYRLLADHAMDMVVQCDLDATLRYVSPSARDLLGHGPDTLIGTRLHEIIHRDDVAGLMPVLDALTSGALDHATAQHRVRRKDGTDLLVETRYRMVGEAGARPAGYIATLRDISERHAAQVALARKTALLELTLENMDQGILLIDEDGTVPVSNRRAQELFELPAALMAAQPPHAVVREHQRRSPRWGSIVEGIPTWVLSTDRRSTDIRTKRRSADNRFLDVRTAPAGRTGGVVRTFTDITDLKRAEEAARATEALFRGLFESATDLLIVCAVAPDGAFALETVNPSAALILGCAAGGVGGRPIEAMLPAPTAARIRADIAWVIGTGDVRRNEDHGLTEDGRIWELVHVPLRHATEDRVGRVFVSIRDITHLRAAEAAVREKTVLLEATLENMDQGLLMIDASGQVLVCNRRAIELLDLPPALVASRPSLGEVVAYLDRHGEYAGVPDEIRTRVEPCRGAVRLHSYERTRPDGTVIEVRTAPLPGGGAVRTFTDITVVRASEKAVRESEARYRLLADNTSDLIVLGQADGHCSYISPAVTSMLGYTVAEAVRNGVGDWIHPKDVATVSAATRALTPEAPTGSVVYRLRHRDGRYIWAEAAFRRAELAGGDHSIITAIRDVTERQQRTEELKVARDVAELAREHADRASQAKTDFLAAMSHEIRTPLNAIIGFTGLMLDAADLPPELRGHAENIAGSGHVLLTLINDILDFSEVEAGGIRLEPKPFAPLSLIDNCLSMVRGLAVNKSLEFRSLIDPELPAVLSADEGRLRQILLNLLNNAVKFTKTGYVALGVRREASSIEGETIRFSVTDTGIGIPKDKQDRLFRNFSQVDGSIRREFGGTGLGLAITKQLVELMGGQVGIFSEEGKGSTFWFTVTLPRGAFALPASKAADLAPTRRCGRLLLVEDVKMNQRLARIILEAAGHKVEVASDGPEAIAAMRDGEFDLVLMDVQMPGMDGIEVTKVIRGFADARSTVPIVAMTANVLPHQVRQFRAAGMDDHVGKPIDRTELYAVIERWLSDGRTPHRAASDSGSEPDPCADRVSFDQLLGLVGREPTREIVQSFRGELEKCFVDGCATVEDRACRRHEAHKLVPASSMLGFRRLFAAITALEATEDDSDFPAALDRARSERDRALRQVAELMPEIDTAPQIAA